MIVDDEPLAHKVLEKYISQVKSLELVTNCKNAMEAINYLHSNSVDLIFLDINMPDLSGIDFLKTLEHKPQVIFTTAYSEFALESYEYGVADYLLKPIKFDRFLKAVNKVLYLVKDEPVKTNAIREIKEENGEVYEEENEYVFFKQDSSVYKVKYSDILYVEAFGNYLKVFTKDQKIVARKTMTEFEKELSYENIIRVQKSYFVNILKIDKIELNQIHIGEKQISIGTIYKSELMKKLNLKK
jgi:DNA-binding LytR/AlgR family response regulator